MPTMIAESTNYTYHFEGAEQVFPCRCGETHRGDDAQENWNRHNCEHGPMSQVRDQMMCLSCRAMFDYISCEDWR